MALIVYDSDKVPYGENGPQVSIDGRVGGAREFLIYIKNNDPSTWYTSITLEVQSQFNNDWGEFGTTGWGAKLMYGERQPTEAEWSLVRSNESINLPDIGTVSASDTESFHPVWVRVYCPAGQPAQHRKGLRIRLGAYPRMIEG